MLGCLTCGGNYSVRVGCIPIVLVVCLFVFLFFQALKVEEKTFSYQAELEILDSTICKANAMEVTFQPVKCPTQVRISFKEARRYQVLKT